MKSLTSYFRKPSAVHTDQETLRALKTTSSGGSGVSSNFEHGTTLSPLVTDYAFPTNKRSGVCIGADDISPSISIGSVLHDTTPGNLLAKYETSTASPDSNSSPITWNGDTKPLGSHPYCEIFTSRPEQSRS